MNNQLRKELKYFVLFLIIMSIFFYLFKRWYDSVPNTYVIKAQDVVPTATQAPAVTTAPKKGYFIKTKVSHYNPALGGVNCLTFKDGECISRMANGRPWKEGINIGMACPSEMKMGTKLYFPEFERTFTCTDRGSMIVKTDSNEYWVDLLLDKPLVPYGKVVEAEVL